MSEQPRAHQFPPGVYPPTTRGLAKYLSETEGLEREESVRVVRRVFEFVKLMVLENGLSLPVYRFGTFSRRLRRAVDHPVLAGPTRAQYVIKFTASQQHGRVRLDEE